MTSHSDDFLFYDLNEEEPVQVKPSLFWDVLIVDDDSEIHSVTKLALAGVDFWGRKLRFHHAFSGQEAIDVLKHHPEICILLLDVVMETDNAGLLVVKSVREDLLNDNVRIILRTGQPGHAPEEQVIKDYDINDYKMKTELTRSKLVTSIMTAIRSYQQICELELQSVVLSNILEASKAILGHNDIIKFSDAVINQLANILHLQPNGLVCGVDAQSNKIIIYGGSSHYQNVFGQSINQLDDDRVITQVQRCFKKNQHQKTDHDLTVLLEGKTRTAAIYLTLDSEPSDAQLKFMEIFLANVSVGLDNIKLFSELRKVAYRDPLTKLPNRASFIESIGNYYSLNRNDYLLALIDVAQFSDINNGLGQDTGNQLLIALKKRIKHYMPNTELFARIGADVFALLIHKDSFNDSDFLSALSKPIKLAEHVLSIHFHIGLCQQSDFNINGLETLKLAYIALNQSKKGEKPIDWFRPELEERMAWKLGLIRQLRQDFEANKLEVWYQPQLSLNDLKVVGCEALLRWPTGNGKYTSPVVFVPLAEDAGLIVDIGQWVLEQAAKQQKQLADLGLDIGIAVNVSVPQFKVPNYAQKVKETLDKYQVHPSKIELEVTESVFMDEINSVIDTLKELKEFGVDVAIDDFGTGFSSLSYLQKLPLARLKIDRAFIKDIPDKDTGAIAQLVISLATHLGLKTIAEGVETPAQAKVLKSLGCNEVQGFMYAKPMPQQQLLEFLKDQK